MERQLFTWDGWDGEPECMTFYNPRLVVDIGIFPMGTTFECASITQNSDGTGTLQFCDGFECVEFKLSYKVGEQIT